VTVEDSNTIKALFTIDIFAPATARDIKVINPHEQSGVIEGAFKVLKIALADFDIKPYPLNLKCQGKLPAEVLGTEEFDVTSIDFDSLRLTREGISAGAAPIDYNITDGATPSHADMLLRFRVPEVVEALLLNELAGQTITLVLTGNMVDGTPLRGQDVVFLLGDIDRECHADFDCDADVDGSDALTFKHNFGRSRIQNPCSDANLCDGDFDTDSDVDGYDALTFKASFGTRLF
jgi:hypothetical protein